MESRLPTGFVSEIRCILTLVLPRLLSVRMPNAALTSQRKTWFILEPNVNDQGLGKEIQLSPGLWSKESNFVTF